jgi:pyridoxamine 5'-phosphate oxidase
MDIASLRKSYERDALDEQASEPDPLQQFRRWFEQALKAELPEPNAMTLATVGADGRPSTRIVLVKGFDERGIVWYTNYHSRKGQELAQQPQAALQFHWVELERVVRIEGRVDEDRVRTRSPTPTTRRGRWTRASVPGPRRRAR